MQQQLLQQPLHEVLQDILTAHEQAAELLVAEEQQEQQQQAGRMLPAARQPAVVAAAAVPTDRQTAGMQHDKPQEQPAKKQKQPRKPRQPKLESAAAPAVSRRRIQPVNSQQHQLSGTHVADGGAQAVAAGGEALAAAARLASSSADQAAFTVVGPAAVRACL